MAKQIYYDLPVDELVKKSLERKEGEVSKTGALVVNTGKYTGRSPDDKFIVDTPEVHDQIDWGKVNVPMSEEKYRNLLEKVSKFEDGLDESFIAEGVLGADDKYALPVEVHCEYAYQALFCEYVLCKDIEKDKKYGFDRLKIYCFPSCLADPDRDGTNSEAFVVLNLKEMTVLIGATKYAGEIKKSMFSVMNYLLPEKGAFPMHCSANMGEKGDTALFFGLSGTGKTTLSADPSRNLIGDDEHGWTEDGVFNFEGGCYAKCINLKKENEPQIWNAIRDSALLENVVMKDGQELDFEDAALTENTRAAYPICYIDNAVAAGKGNQPDYVVFLTADAFGILPPVAKLSIEAAEYYFLSGYTAKLAGTERGIVEPQATFSACFGAPFMPRPATVYSDLLKKYVSKYNSQVYLVNTGWIGGAYGVGERISIKLTRQIITDILTGVLDKDEYKHNGLLNLDTPAKLDDPRDSWENKDEYEKKAADLITLFKENFKKFPDADVGVISAGPQ
ncbi:phosphoenolpyruvate carboxykinase (ATP) [Patescibacteria group bacterium]|nr:phosphoenolpyruvate carboxykinase (ATP) [Patescibacteria group bacterium]MBU1673703.1 phosphoenolpyruvate carboxykinase (ATP) [Patescibacteria group bacterium]MBU1963068.1 phosphoenolpyruvate carboxykinase (ATP) [Patescibacteria group bacterium]